jgi:hypothetical protein
MCQVGQGLETYFTIEKFIELSYNPFALLEWC